MYGRILGIKKTLFLRGFAVFATLCFVALCLLSVYVFKIPDLWFYGFCLCLGSFEILKSMLFKLDSSFYLGTLVEGIGVVGFIFCFLHTPHLAPFYILLAFISASLLTSLFCGQRFHLIIAFSLSFVGLYAYLLTKSFITPPIFIAFVTAFLVLFILEILLSIKRRR